MNYIAKKPCASRQNQRPVDTKQKSIKTERSWGNHMKTLGQLWSKKIYSSDLNYKTLQYWIEGIPLVVVINLPTGRFRVFTDGDIRHDITNMMRSETLELIISFAEADLGIPIGHTKQTHLGDVK